MIKIHDKAVTELMPKIGVRNFAVLLVIVKHMNKDKTAFPSRARIQKLTRLGRDSVIKSLNELVGFGLLKREQRNVKGGKFGSNLYTVKSELFGGYYGGHNKKDLPRTDLPYTAEPYTAEPYTAEPYTAEPYTEKPHAKYKPSIEVQTSKEVQTNFSNHHQKGRNDDEEKNAGRNISDAPTGATSANAPKEKSSAKKERVIWKESGYTGAVGLAKLEADLLDINPDYIDVDVGYYRDAVAVWSVTAKNDKVDWLATVLKFIHNDNNSQKLKLKSHVRQKTQSETFFAAVDAELAARGF